VLEVRKNTYSKNYENIFFREFARHLYKSFSIHGRSGLLLGSPVCEADERLQIDALLITEQVVCIIDFKNFSGKINLPNEENFEMGMWTNVNGDQIKGGSSINPFIQLKNQKRRFSEVYKKHIQNQLHTGDTFNPHHTIRIICFQEEIELDGKIPSKEALNFFILDKINFLEGLLDIVDVSDKDVKVSSLSYDAFKSIFHADIFKFDDKPLEDKLKVFADKSVILDYKKLYPDQHSALSEIKAFLENPEEQIFVLQGTANSGKSYLIPFIQELAYGLEILETEIFASSSRVANNLVAIAGLERVNSIYSYIYGGHKNNNPKDEQDKEDENSRDTTGSETIQIEEISLRNCDNAENALFIVDESQLISDSFNQSIDLIFGTGYLLKDFLSFTDFKNSKRKIIFIGDPFQLQLGKTDESPLNPLYLEEAYKLKTDAYQLLDKPDFSLINKEALFCVNSIRTKHFNSLNFNKNSDFLCLQKDEIEESITKMIHHKKDCHILCFSKDEAQKINHWIKQSIIKNGHDIAINDLVLFNNNISIENTTEPFPESKKIYNGQFATVIEVNDKKSEITITPKNSKEPTVLIFREVSLKLNDSGQKVTVLSLENYRLNAKSELSKDEIVALKIHLNSYSAKFFKSHPSEKTEEYSEILKSVEYVLLETEIENLKQQLKDGKKVKTKLDEKNIEQKNLFKSASKNYRSQIESKLRKDSSSEYYKFKNSAFLRFGWAMTVHKSMSYKWDEVIFNVEKAGTTNENHFRWLYTGISRARKKVSLINYKPISPFDRTELIDCNSGISANEFFYISENKESEIRLSEFKDFISNKLTDTNIEIEKVENLNWQERYHLKNDAKKTIISFSYNGKGQFRFPTPSGGDSVFGSTAIEHLKSKCESFNFLKVKDIWRKIQYEFLSTLLQEYGLFFSQIIQTNFKDKIKLLNDENEEMDLEIDYNGDGAFSKIIAKYYSDVILFQSLEKAIEQIRK
jgi:hypothetical protein